MDTMSSTEFQLQGADGGKNLVIELDQQRVPVVDLRHETEIPALEKFAVQLRNGLRGPDDHPQIHLILLVLPQPSDTDALNLARRGIQVLTGSKTVPAPIILDRFRRSWAAAPRTAPPPLPPRRGNPDAGVFSQAPPGFDPTRFAERMRLLERPWQDDTDRRESDY